MFIPCRGLILISLDRKVNFRFYADGLMGGGAARHCAEANILNFHVVMSSEAQDATQQIVTGRPAGAASSSVFTSYTSMSSVHFLFLAQQQTIYSLSAQYVCAIEAPSK